MNRNHHRPKILPKILYGARLDRPETEDISSLKRFTFNLLQPVNPVNITEFISVPFFISSFTGPTHFQPFTSLFTLLAA
ncbi:hypothetical protein DB346_21085 [Verrucomicrobia bacterium LW23]|nr:hypothetical protein DB346_21085 [Verrucomicrobia bacterium LW23]